VLEMRAEFPGWIWCRSSEGREGSVPAELLPEGADNAHPRKLFNPRTGSAARRRSHARNILPRMAIGAQCSRRARMGSSISRGEISGKSPRAVCIGPYLCSSSLRFVKWWKATDILHTVFDRATFYMSLTLGC